MACNAADPFADNGGEDQPNGGEDQPSGGDHQPNGDEGSAGHVQH